MKEKLIKIQQELEVPKEQKNEFGGYMYRSCEDILEAVKPLLKKYNLLLSLTDKIVTIGDSNYVKATAKLEDDNGGEIEVNAYAREAKVKKGMDDSQITGAASSYARKYALNGLFLIDDTKDADATQGNDNTAGYGRSPDKKEDTGSKKPIPITKKQIKYLIDLHKQVKGEPIGEDKMSKIRKLDAVKASELIDKWQKEAEENKKAEEIADRAAEEITLDDYELE